MKSYYYLSATAAIFMMMMSSSLIHVVVAGGARGGSSASGSATASTTTTTATRRRDLVDTMALGDPLGSVFANNHYKHYNADPVTADRVTTDPDPVTVKSKTRGVLGGEKLGNGAFGGDMDFAYTPMVPINTENKPKYETGLRGSSNGKWKRYKHSKKGKKDKKGCRHKNGNHHHGHRYPQRNCNPNPNCINYAAPGRKKCCSTTLSPSPTSSPTSSPSSSPVIPAPAAPCFCRSMGQVTECDISNCIKPSYQDVEWCTEDDYAADGKPNYDANDPSASEGGAVSTGTSGGAVSTGTEPIAPTDSPMPSTTPEPSSLQIAQAQGSSALTPGSDISQDISSKNYCQIFPAKFESTGDGTGDTAIVLWSSGTDKDLEANAIAAINSIVPTPILESGTSKYMLDVNFKIIPSNADLDKDDKDNDDDFDLIDVGIALDEIVSPPMVLAVAGCKEEAREMATEYFLEKTREPRKLQTTEEGSESKLAVMRDWICVFKNDGEENSCDADGECDVSCSTSINYIGDLGFEAIQAIIEESLVDYFGMIDDVTSWYEQQVLQQGVDFNIEEVSTGSGISEINETVIQERKSATKAGPFIGAAAGLLALLLLLLLFVRRRNRYDGDEVSHLKMDENADDDDTFVREFGLGGDGGSDDNSAKADYNTRDIHIVGEGDSVISHWTGYTDRGKPSDGNYEMELYNKNGVQGITTDVHQCSSATCEICARNRQAGLSFISTGGAGANDDLTRNRSLPSDASREYPIEDTVEL